MPNSTTNEKETIMKLEAPMIYTSLGVYGGGFLASLAAIVCMVTIKQLPANIRATLVSFAVANLFGTGYLLVYTVSMNFDLGWHLHGLLVGITCSTTLSITHLLCLVLAEYIIISSKFKTASKSFTGFLFISWIVCIIACANLIFVDKRTQSTVSFSLVLLSYLGFVGFYLTVMKFHRNRASYINAIKRSYLREGDSPKGQKEEILYPRVILANYFACVLPFAVRGIYNVIVRHSFADNLWDFMFLILFSLNYYVVGFVCIYLRFKKYFC